MVKFLGSPLEIPDAVTTTQAVRKAVTDALATRVTTLEGQTASSGGYTVVSKSAAYTAVASNYVLADATSAAFTITLPASPVSGTKVAVKKVDTTANAVTVVGSGATTIDGDPNLVLASPKVGAVVYFDGSNWQIHSVAVFDTGGQNLTFRGTYSSSTAYAANDVVYFSGSAYVALVANTNVSPTAGASSATWNLLALSGTSNTAYPTGQVISWGTDSPATDLYRTGASTLSTDALFQALSGDIRAGSATSTTGTLRLYSNAGQVGTELYEGTILRWVTYMTGSNSPYYIRDQTNTRMHAIFTPGASNNAAITEFASTVQVDGSALTVGAGGASGTGDGTLVLNQGANSAGAGSALLFQTNGVEKWRQYLASAASGSQQFFLRDQVNARMQVTYTAGTTALLASSDFGSSVNVQGNLTVSGTMTGIPTGGTSGQVLAKNTGTTYDTAWVTPTAASGVLTPTTITASTTATANQYYNIDASSNLVTLTLPTSPASGTIVGAKRVDTTGVYAITVVGGGGSLFETGIASRTFPNSHGGSYPYEEYLWNGSVWRVIRAQSQCESQYLPTITSGSWYSRRNFSTSPVNAMGAVTPSTSLIYYVPCWFSQPVSFSTLALVNTTASTSGALCRLGLYTSTSAGLPGALVFDAGTVSISTTANNISQLAYSGLTPKGWAFWALSFNNTASGSLATYSANPVHPAMQGTPNASFSWSNAMTSGTVEYYTQTGNATAAALASTATPTAVYGASQATFEVFFKAA